MTNTPTERKPPVIGCNTATWKGVSGRAVETKILPLGAALPCCPGTYILCGQSNSELYPLIVGVADDLAERLNDSLTYIPDFKILIEAGASVVCFVEIEDIDNRKQLMRELILALDPPYNCRREEPLPRRA